MSRESGSTLDRNHVPCQELKKWPALSLLGSLRRQTSSLVASFFEPVMIFQNGGCKIKGIPSLLLCCRRSTADESSESLSSKTLQPILEAHLSDEIEKDIDYPTRVPDDFIKSPELHIGHATTTSNKAGTRSVRFDDFPVVEHYVVNYNQHQDLDALSPISYEQRSQDISKKPSQRATPANSRLYKYECLSQQSRIETANPPNRAYQPPDAFFTTPKPAIYYPPPHYTSHQRRSPTPTPLHTFALLKQQTTHLLESLCLVDLASSSGPDLHLPVLASTRDLLPSPPLGPDEYLAVDPAMASAASQVHTVRHHSHHPDATNTTTPVPKTTHHLIVQRDVFSVEGSNHPQAFRMFAQVDISAVVARHHTTKTKKRTPKNVAAVYREPDPWLALAVEELSYLAGPNKKNFNDKNSYATAPVAGITMVAAVEEEEKGEEEEEEVSPATLSREGRAVIDAVERCYDDFVVICASGASRPATAAARGHASATTGRTYATTGHTSPTPSSFLPSAPSPSSPPPLSSSLPPPTPSGIDVTHTSSSLSAAYHHHHHHQNSLSKVSEFRRALRNGTYQIHALLTQQSEPFFFDSRVDVDVEVPRRLAFCVPLFGCADPVVVKGWVCFFIGGI